MLSAHPFWSLDVPRLDGQLLLTPCPGSQQVPMADALAQLQLAGAGGVLTLMTVEELALCGPLSLGQLVQARVKARGRLARMRVMASCWGNPWAISSRAAASPVRPLPPWQ